MESKRSHLSIVLAAFLLALCSPINGQLEQRIANLESRLAAAESRLDVLQAGRPSAHMDGGTNALVSVTDASDLKFWNPNAGRSHLRGGFTYNAPLGALIVPRSGRYFVYAQMWNFQAGGVRHFIYANGRRLVVGGSSDGQSQTTWAAGTFFLNAGEGITIRLVSRGTTTRTVWPGGAHTYFGAFLVD